MTSGQVADALLIGNLTPKQEAFCLHYLACGNGSEAARRAGYEGDTDTIKVTASDNLTKPNIQARLRSLRERMSLSEKQTIATIERRKARLTEILEHPIETPVSAGHVIAASHQLNLMDKVYEPGGQSRQEVKVITLVLNNEQKATITTVPHTQIEQTGTNSDYHNEYSENHEEDKKTDR